MDVPPPRQGATPHQGDYDLFPDERFAMEEAVRDADVLVAECPQVLILFLFTRLIPRVSTSCPAVSTQRS
jgi:hypothetical protein